MIKKDKRKRILIMFMISTCLFISSCTTDNQEDTTNDVLTQKKSEDGRTRITVLTKYAFTTYDFEKAVEKEFPDIDIVLVGDYTANTALGKEYEARLEHDDLTDIVMTWPYDVGSQYWKDRLIDMSGMPFTNKYNVSMLDSIADENDNLYYLPGPASIRGIVYNKTMFEENGWEVPNNYTEFVALCKQIEATGNRAFQIPLGNDEVLDTAFTGFNFGTSYSKPEDASWLATYNEGNGKFLDHFGEAVDTFQALINDGIIKESDLELHYNDTQGNLYTRGTVMTEDSVQLIKIAKTQGGSKDEYAIMPFFNRDPESTWARLYMVCYIGMSKHLQDKGNEEQYDKVMKVMNYISTPDGQAALASGNGTMYSSLKDAKISEDKEIEDMRTTLAQGRYGIFPTLERSESALRRGLQGMLKGTTTKEQLGEMVDKENQIPTREEKLETYGKASEDFSLMDTGNFISDVIRTTSKSDFALFMDNGKDGLYSGKGVSGKFYKGSITEVDMQRVMPDYKFGEKGELWKITMTGENLMKTLEYSMSINNITGWFYYFSGLKVTFDPTADPGSRIKSIKTSDGEKIIKDKEYSIAVMEESVPNEYIISCEKTGVLIKDLLIQEIQEKKTISPSNDGRFTIKEE
ncbi:5'-nucleotidase C-terminal domain-containing protein [Amedibacillus sp. YH-ame6]